MTFVLNLLLASTGSLAFAISLQCSSQILFVCSIYWNGRMVLLLSDSTVYGYSGCLVLRCSRSRACFSHFCSLEEMSDHGILVSGIFPLVPGAGVYYTAYYFVTDSLRLASQKGIESLKMAFAIVLGIVFVVSIPKQWFQVSYWKNKRK